MMAYGQTDRAGMSLLRSDLGCDRDVRLRLWREHSVLLFLLCVVTVLRTKYYSRSERSLRYFEVCNIFNLFILLTLYLAPIAYVVPSARPFIFLRLIVVFAFLLLGRKPYRIRLASTAYAIGGPR